MIITVYQSLDDPDELFKFIGKPVFVRPGFLLHNFNHLYGLFSVKIRQDGLSIVFRHGTLDLSYYFSKFLEVALVPCKSLRITVELVLFLRYDARPLSRDLVPQLHLVGRVILVRLRFELPADDLLLALVDVVLEGLARAAHTLPAIAPHITLEYLYQALHSRALSQSPSWRLLVALF